jgi:hypothetical protein
MTAEVLLADGASLGVGPESQEVIAAAMVNNPKYVANKAPVIRMPAD